MSGEEVDGAKLEWDGDVSAINTIQLKTIFGDTPISVGSTSGSLMNIQDPIDDATIDYKNRKIIFKIDEKYHALGGGDHKGNMVTQNGYDIYKSSSDWEISFPLNCTTNEARQWWNDLVKEKWKKVDVEEDDKDLVLTINKSSINGLWSGGSINGINAASSTFPSSSFGLSGDEGKIEIKNDGTLIIEDEDGNVEQHNLKDLIKDIREMKKILKV
jgi:hypothetical protein